MSDYATVRRETVIKKLKLLAPVKLYRPPITDEEWVVVRFNQKKPDISILAHMRQWFQAEIVYHEKYIFDHVMRFGFFEDCRKSVRVWLSLRHKGIRICSKDMSQLIGKYIWAMRATLEDAPQIIEGDSAPVGCHEGGNG